MTYTSNLNANQKLLNYKINRVEYASNNKRIAKNTIFLYIRMLVMMAVSLFTFRELLKELGVDDYGTYNVVGGVVILFSFLSSAMTLSNQRFLSYHIGKGDIREVRRVFSMIINVQLVISLIIVILAETIGLWFVNCEMNFETGTMKAVNWVYQFSIFTFIIQILQIPYTSALISQERMSFFSYLSIGEAFIKLGVVLSLSLFMSNRLIIYAGLLMLSALLILGVYYLYCNKAFDICHYKKLWDRNLFSKLIGFSGWNMFGGLGNVAAGQGINILFNLFCGVVANAAMGVSHQVSAAVNSLVSNMQVAFNPQITKSYAKTDYTYFNSLIFRASRLSFFLIFLFGVPIIMCANSILNLWLADVPEYTVNFTQLTIVYCMIDALSGPLWTGAQAIGDVKMYTIWLTTFTLLYLPVAYILLKLGLSPSSVIVARIILTIILHAYRIIYLSYKCEFPGLQFFKNVTLKAFLSFVVMTMVVAPIMIIIPVKYNSLWCLPIYLNISFLLSWNFMLNKQEKKYITTEVKKIYAKFIRSL